MIVSKFKAYPHERSQDYEGILKNIFGEDHNKEEVEAWEKKLQEVYTKVVEMYFGYGTESWLIAKALSVDRETVDEIVDREIKNIKEAKSLSKLDIQYWEGYMGARLKSLSKVKANRVHKHN